MNDLIDRTLRRHGQQLPGLLSMPGDDRYLAATAIWAKPVGRSPRAVIHCGSREDVQTTVRVTRDSNLPLSVRAGGHDWAGRSLCDGIVIDLSGMRNVTAFHEHSTAIIGGGARALDVVNVTDPLGLAAVTAGSVGAVGMSGLTLGWGYGSPIGRAGLALDNLIAAEVVLADGRIIKVRHDNEPEQYWALRGGEGTGSHHIAIEDTVVPSENFLDLIGEPCEPGPLYKAVPQIPPPLHGAFSVRVAEGALDDLIALSHTGRQQVRAAVPMPESEIFQGELGRVAADVRAARAFLHAQVASHWQHALNDGALKDEVFLMQGTQAAIWLMTTCVRIADTCFALGAGKLVLDCSEPGSTGAKR
jgi:hypothetical protein